MPSDVVKKAPPAIPDGYAAVAVTPDQLAAPLRVCVVVKKHPDPVAGHLVPLRDMLDAQVYLGCVTDAAGVVQQWVELWVQNTAGLADSLPASRETLTNAILDDRWARHVKSFHRLDPATIIRTGWETAHPRPVFIDLAKLQPLHPVEPSNHRPWQLCRDDALLSSQGLPPYGSTLHRYLYLPEAGAQSPFVLTTPDAPTNAATIPLTELTAGRKDLIPLNAAGGLMMVRAYSPVSFESFIDLVGGGATPGLPHGRSSLKLQSDAPSDSNGALTGDGWLYLGKHGKSGRLLETLHLKLRALADAVADVAAIVREQQRPLLNLSVEGLQVRLADAGVGLPALWTAKAALVDPGDALELAIEGSDAKYFIPGRTSAASIYRPDVASHPVHGRGAVRIRQALNDAGGATIVEGTLATQERIHSNKNDIVWMRLLLSSGPINLYARLESEKAMAAGEYRFRTVPQRFSQQVQLQLNASAGVPINNTPFEVLSQLSSPCDLYALAVLAVRTLLVDAHTPLPVALDEILSLARQVALEHDPAVSLGLRVRAVFDRDPRYLASLGPHHLVHEQVEPQQAFDLIPAEVWYDTLALIVRMFPGIGPDSRCADYGDAPPGGLHKIFDRAAADLQSLLVRTRSLIVIDWRANREIHAVIRGYLTGLSGPAAPASHGKAATAATATPAPARR